VLRPNVPESSTGLGDLLLALKWRRLDGAPWLGDFAIQPGLKLPTSGSGERGTSTGTTDGSLLLISSHAFGPVSLDLNVGGTVRSGDGSAAPTRASAWTAALALPVAGTRLGGRVFGLPRDEWTAGSPPLVAVLLGPTDAATLVRARCRSDRARHGPGAARGALRGVRVEHRRVVALPARHTGNQYVA
jgi:hypothetical protein